MSWLGRNGGSAPKRSGIVTVLDVGSNKVCCIVAQLQPTEPAQLLKARFAGDISVGQTGAWLKERRAGSTVTVNVGAKGGALQGTVTEHNVQPIVNTSHVERSSS